MRSTQLLRSAALTLGFLLVSVVARAADDPYNRWAVAKFGATAVNNPALQPTVWGEQADPDGDGLRNLLEYTADTNPSAWNQLSDCYQYSVPTGGAPASRFPQLIAWLRTDDPDLRVVCQTSPDLGIWWPNLPIDFDQPPPSNPYVYAQDTGAVAPGLRQMRYTDAQSLANRPGAFMRLLIARRGQTVAGPGLEPFSLTSQTARPHTTLNPSVVRSNTIVLGGFTGTLSFAIPAGVTLYVNGVAVSGSVAVVKAGDHLWMEAYAPGTPGVPRHFDLTIGGHTARWTVTAAALASVPTGSTALPGGSGPESGYTPVEAGVSDTGAAQISIPIVVSPGTAGMQPKLALSYSSQGGNGPLGLGFSLSGLSAISRVGRTIAQDGVKGGIAFDANDRYSLDGQRLIAINGPDGGHQTEYRLEFDPTSRIISRGIEEGGVQEWTVETKSGLKMRFGGPLADGFNARIRPENCPSTLVWAIREMEDSAGNKIQFIYDLPASSRGEVLLARIAYTINAAAGLSANQEVVCEYEDRPDTRTNYVAGFAVKMLKRLTAVESRATEGGTMQRVRRYTTAFIQDAINNDSKLVSVQEMTASGTTLPPTMFDWPASAATNFLNTSTDAGFTIYDRVTPNFIGDFDGDGKTDYLQWHTPQLNFQYNLLLSTGAAFSAPIATGLNPDNAVPLIPADYDGDGKTDVMVYSGSRSRFNLRLSNGAGFGPVIQTDVKNFDDAYRNVLPGDFNGDGRTDLLVWNSTRAKFDTYFSNGTNFDPPVATNVTVDGNATYNRDHMYPGEFNGDGQTDLLVFNLSRGKYDICYSTGTGFTAPVPTDIVNYANAYGPGISGDFNGDGLTDFMGYDNFSTVGFYRLYLCNGSGFQPQITTAVTGGQDSLGVKYRQSVDFNGDGKMDMANWHTPFNNFRLNIWISNGTGFYPAVATPIQRADDVLNEVGDFNGDGKTDMLIYHWPTSSRMNLFLNIGPDQPMIQRVTNGHGIFTSFAFKPLTDASVYTKGTGSPYPCYDLQASMYVVSSVTSRNGIDGDAFTGAGAGTPGENTVAYRYEGAWTCLDGRGFQGFKAVETKDETSGIITRSESLPLTVTNGSVTTVLGSRPSRSEQRLALPLPVTTPPTLSSLISESTMTWNVAQTTHPTGRKTYFVSEAGSVAKSYEVNRLAATALVKTVTRSGPGVGGAITYDANANLLQSTTTTTAGGQTFTETVVNGYTDQTGVKWFLGRLTSSSVTKTAPGMPSLTRSSSFAYHATTGLLTQEVIEPGGGILRQQKDYSHDGFGNILTSTISTAGESSRVTTTSYSTDGRFVASTTNAASHSESKTYDPLLGNVLTQTGPNGLTTRWEYDALGRPIREVRPDGTETRSFYRRVTATTAGAPPRAVHFVRVQSSGGAPRTVWYDLLDREIRTDGVSFDGSTVSAHKVYNARGEVTDASQPYFAGDTPLYSAMLYDAVGREYQQTDPGSRVTKTTHDGLTTTVERNYNPAALTQFQKAVTTVNAMGWTVSSSQHLGTAAKTISRTYDAYGSLKTVTDPAGNMTSLDYDVRGNKIAMSEPNSGASGFTYNGFGELKTQTNAAGQQVSLNYDLLGRVVTRTEPEGTTSFIYDTAARGIGQLASEQGPGFSRSYFYDALSRPTATVETHGFHRFATSRSYDAYGRPDALTFPTGLGVRQSYTALGHLGTVQNAANPSLFYWSALQVNARGQVTQEVLGNGVVTDRAFDPQTGLVDAISASFNAAGDIQKSEFDFDLIGNLTERRDRRFATPFIEHFGYDTLNRLETVDTTGRPTVSANYNDLGNITSRSDVGAFAYARTNGAGPHAITGISGSPGGAFDKACAYNAKGERVTDGATALDYSSFGKPTRIRKGGDTLAFAYGPDRALYRQTIFRTDAQGIETQTVREYIGGLYERETTSEGLVRHIHYIAGGSGVAAILTDERSASTAAQRTRFFHKDHLGSVDVITDSAGAVVERQSFDAWGRRRTVAHSAGTWTVTYPAAPASASSAETHRGFTGHEMLDAVGLVHMGGRIYDPITARFLSPDPFVQSPDNLQNLNRYSYVLNNPLSFTDPSGFFFKSISKFFKKTSPLGWFLNDKQWNQVFSAAIGIGLSIVTAGWGAPVFLSGAIGGFGSAFSGTLLAGGSVGDALKAGLRSGAISGATAGALNGLSDKYGWSGKDFAGYSGSKFAEKLAEKTIAHGIAGGIGETLSGGKFVHGFMSSAAAAASSPMIYTQTHDISDALGAVASGVVGGTVSQIGGGKFANGAISGAMGYLSNTLGDDIADASEQMGTAIVETIGMEASQALVNYSAGFIDTFAGEGYFQNHVVATGSGWQADSQSDFYSAGEAATFAIGGVGGRSVRAGRELNIGATRIAPLGNKGASRISGHLPHYHRRGVGPDGVTKPGQGIGRHRPWESKSTDKSFRDRF